jgi:hypothetical protein
VNISSLAEASGLQAGDVLLKVIKIYTNLLLLKEQYRIFAEGEKRSFSTKYTVFTHIENANT